MKKLLLLLAFPILGVSAQIEGTWKLAPQAGALAVGPQLNDLSWFSSSIGDVTTRACLFDDSIKFAPGGVMTHYMDGSTWLEAWQGAPEGCGTPVAPHTGGAATYAFDAALGTLTVNGLGAHIGLAKVFNGGELTPQNPLATATAITYNVAFSNGGNTMTAQINIGGGWWQFVYQKTVLITPAIEGTWKLAPQAGALAVGPQLNDLSWFSSSTGDVTTRACLFDDSIKFAPGGVMTHYMDGSTWLEAWQGAPEGCGTPVAPHTGGAATYAFDAALGTLTVNGLGAHIGLAKVFNGGELTPQNPLATATAITYNVAFSNGGNTMTAQINIGGGWWQFVYQKAAVINPPTPNVTFKVDMSQYTGPAFTTVNLNGTFNTFCGACNPMTDTNMDGIWEVTLPLPNGSIQYKFTLDGWFGEEQFVGGESCTISTPNGSGGFYINRSYTVTGDATLGTVCYNSCTACVAGIEDLSSQMVSVYPNPSNGTLAVEANASAILSNITNIMGETVIALKGNESSINIESLSAGIYFLNFTVKGENQTIRIIRN